MRRVAALAITMSLAWLLVARLGTEPAGSAALALGVALIAASIVGWLFEFLRLPRITGYLAFGLLCGPLVANIITEPMARDLRAASGFAIARHRVHRRPATAAAARPAVARRDGVDERRRRWRVAWIGLAVVAVRRLALAADRAGSDRLPARGGRRAHGDRARWASRRRSRSP